MKNPILPGQFADPSLIKYNDRYYLYPTTDGCPGWSGTVFHAFSSDDLLDWRDEGVIVDVASEQVPWAVGSAWAPAMFERDGRFYFYFCAKRPDGVSCIGAAVSDSPVRDFRAMSEPLLTLDFVRSRGLAMGQTIDPSIYEDEESGDVWLLFGNGAPEMVKLTDDLCHIVPETLCPLEGLDDFREAVDVKKRGGIYHFTWSCDDTGSPDYHVNYGVSDSLFGPVKTIGPILTKKPEWDILGPGHHAVFREPDEDVWYIVHHRFATPTAAYPGYHGFHREVCVERLRFSPDGYMLPVEYESPANPAGGYLFVHFTSECPDGEQIYFALSRDGLHWQDLSEMPILRSHIGMEGVRDPFPVRDPDTGRVYLIATDLRIDAGLGWGAAQYEGSRDIIVWESDDLLHWSPERACTVGIPEAGCVWAPEAVWDPRKGCFFVFFASMVKTGDEEPKQRIYAVRTKDFKTFTPALQILERPRHVIDTTIFESGGRYFRVSGDNATERLLFEVSDTLDGDYTPVPSETLANLPGVEGPECYLLPDGKTWCLIADQFAAAKGYLPMVTDAPGERDFRILSPEEYDMGGLKKRHGGVLRITELEYRRLADAYGIQD